MFRSTWDSYSATDSSAGSTFYTFASGFSATIPPGIGPLSGRFILGFGKTVLNGVEAVFIRRRISYIQSLCPLLDERPPLNVQSIFDDLLELVRYLIVSNIRSISDADCY
jgi:hypothetical protein